MEKSIALNEEKKQELYSSIYDDSMWLVNLTENLLSITRIENWHHASANGCPALGRCVSRGACSYRPAGQRSIGLPPELPDDLLMARMDVRLIVQVIINIVNNAIKYTPAGSHIVLRAERWGSMVEVSIADDGPGISDEAKAHLFDMFYTASQGKSDNRRGLGLGLSLCPLNCVCARRHDFRNR